MKKNYLLLLFTLLIINSYSQEYSKMISNGTYKVSEIQQEAEAYFAIRGKGKGTGYKQYKRWEYQALRDMDANGYLKSPAFYYKELQRYNSEQNKKNVQAKTNADTGNWQLIGPTVNSPTASDRGLGRLTSFAYSKTDANHLIVGSETGGVWKSLDGGLNWTVLTDNLANIDVYALAIDPTNHDNYFWGSTNGTMFKSTNAGSTWTTLASNIGTGKINRILIDPTNTAKMYCAVETSGLYQSTNSGASWSLIHADANDYGYDFEFKPNDPSVIYASGTKVFKSIDGGASFTKLEQQVGLPNWSIVQEEESTNWYSKTKGRVAPNLTLISPHSGTNLGLFEIGTGSEFAVTKIVTTPLNISGATSPKLNFWYALPNYGGDVDILTVYYKTSAAGSWVELATYNTAQDTWTDIELDLPNPSADYYIAFEGSVENNGGGITLDDVSISDGATTYFTDGFESGTPNDFGEGAKMLAVTPANASLVYILEASSTTNGHLNNLFKSTDSGANFTTLNHTGHNYFGYETTSTSPGDATTGQAPRDMDIAISPTNVNEVYIAGINTWRSLDGGDNFTATSHWTKSLSSYENIGYHHADVDLLEYHNSELFVCSDGGLFKASNSGSTLSTSFYTDLTDGLAITQFYKIGVSQTNPVVITGGTQDNGSLTKPSSGVWTHWKGGDGQEGFVDKNVSTTIYGSFQYGGFVKSTNSGASNVGIPKPAGEAKGNFLTPFEQDPITVNTIYSGFKKVYKTSDDGANWTAISQDFGTNLDHLKIAPSLNTTMYTAFGSSLYKTTTADGSNWTQVTGVSGLINSIAIHPTNPNKVAVATTGNDKVYVTVDGGLNWTSYLHNLPDFSALALAWDTNGNDGLYLGMNYGIYYIDTTTSNSWQPFSNLLPNVKIAELEVNYADGKLYAATYGRGVWKSPRYHITTLATVQFSELNAITMYPNPTTNEVNLAWNKNEDTTVRIFNSQGKLLYYSKDVNLLNNHKIDVSQFSSGLYFVRINSKEGIATKKLIIK